MVEGNGLKDEERKFLEHLQVVFETYDQLNPGMVAKRFGVTRQKRQMAKLDLNDKLIYWRHKDKKGFRVEVGTREEIARRAVHTNPGGPCECCEWDENFRCVVVCCCCE